MSCGAPLSSSKVDLCDQCAMVEEVIARGLMRSTNADIVLGRHESCVYAIGPAEPTLPIKIGVSTSVLKRYRALQGMSPLPLEIFAVMRCRLQYEHRIHAALAEYRVHGEWFKRAPPTLELVKMLEGDQIEQLNSWLRARGV